MPLHPFVLVATEPPLRMGARKTTTGAYTVVLRGLGVRGCVLKYL